MKFIHNFKAFESTTSVTQHNEDYIDLLSVIQSEIFDDFNIVAKTTEEFEYGIEMPEHKFWAYRVGARGAKMTSNPQDFKDRMIEDIKVYNIPDSEEEEFTRRLSQCEDRVKDITGKTMIFTSDVWLIHDDSNPKHYWDFTIKLISSNEMDKTI
jgi:hypothetical protein